MSRMRSLARSTFGFGIGGSVSSDPDAYLAYIIPGIVALTTLSATFSTVSMRVLVQRLFYMSFDELLLCPIHVSAIVLGKCMTGVVRGLLTCTVLMLVGRAISPEVGLEPLAFVVVLFASLTFSLLGLLAGMLTNKSQKLSMFSALVIVPMTFLCGTIFSVSALPSVVGDVVWVLPLTHSSEIIRAGALGWDIPWISVLILFLYMVAFYILDYTIIRKKLYRSSSTKTSGSLRIRRTSVVVPAPEAWTGASSSSGPGISSSTRL